jgi:[ribosomal protein S18]-alanine N-acetyltransferase
VNADDVRVRFGVAADLDGVVGLERVTEHAPHWAAADYAAILNGAGEVRRRLLVAEVGDELVGFAVGKVVRIGEERVAELESVAVKAEARRGGIGRRLCKAVIDWCRVEGAAAMELEVRAGSGGAIGLYEGLGFVRVGVRRGYYRDPADDALLMRLDLAK